MHAIRKAPQDNGKTRVKGRRKHKNDIMSKRERERGEEVACLIYDDFYDFDLLFR